MEKDDSKTEESTEQGISPVESVRSDAEAKYATAIYTSSELSQNEGQESLIRQWKPTLLRFGPLSGIASMLVAVASIVASLGILAGSDHKPVKSWAVPPSTYLAIFTALANLSMRYAAIQGVVITWWVRAGRGSTLAGLHWDYRSGTTLLGALTAGKRTGLLALACIFSTVVVIDGPLLQRSTSVVPAKVSGETRDLRVSMVPELPRDYTGSWAFNNELVPGDYKWDGAFNMTYHNAHGKTRYNNIVPQASFDFLDDVAANWGSDAPIRNSIRGCQETCDAVIRAPALAALSCTNRVVPVNYSIPYNDRSGSAASPLYEEAFIVVPFLDLNRSQEVIDLITAYATITDPKDCSGYLNISTCSLVSAIGEYNVAISNDTFTLLNAGTPKIIALANNTQVNRDSPRPGFVRPSTLAGLAGFIYANMGGHVVCQPIPSVQCYASAAGAYQRYARHDQHKCPSYRDPNPDIRTAFNKIMVYAGASVASKSRSFLEARLDPGIEYNTTVTGYVTGTQNVFETAYLYFMGAAIVEVICIALVLPTYWGWWTIGRPCSFSPLEVAKAFEAPILVDCNSNSSGRDLARTVGATRVRYGVVGEGSPDGGTKLAVASANRVKLPTDGMRFNT